MSYSSLYLQEKGPRVPVPLAAVFVLILTVVFGRFFFMNNASFSQASKKSVRRVEIVNLNPVQANIFWQSEVAEEGYVFYGDSLENVRSIALDDRDLTDKKGQYLNHYITLRNLKPGTPYFFKIVAKNQVVVKPDGTLFSFKTPKSSSVTSPMPPANGKVLKENLTGLDGAVVLLYVDGMYPLATLSKPTGEWLIPLNSFFNQESLDGQMVSEIQKVRVEILSEDNQLTTLNGKLSNLSPVSTTIVIGKSYNLLDSGTQVLSAQSGKPKHKEIDVIYPVEGALIPGRAPLIKGAARPNEQVFITVNSRKTYSAVVKADLDGLWNYALPESLELGNHTVTITTKDKNGKDVTMTRKFVIIANDYEGKVLGEASGSPTIAVTKAPTPQPTAGSYSTPTPAVTFASQITPTGLARTGVMDLAPAIGGISFIIVGLGFLLVF